jgi:hypothetical protein
VVVKRKLPERILALLDDWSWLEKFVIRRTDFPRGKTPQDGALFHELDPRYRRFPGPAADELANKMKSWLKGKERPVE